MLSAISNVGEREELGGVWGCCCCCFVGEDDGGGGVWFVFDEVRE